MKIHLSPQVLSKPCPWSPLPARQCDGVGGPGDHGGTGGKRWESHGKWLDEMTQVGGLEHFLFFHVENHHTDDFFSGGLKSPISWGLNIENVDLDGFHQPKSRWWNIGVTESKKWWIWQNGGWRGQAMWILYIHNQTMGIDPMIYWNYGRCDWKWWIYPNMVNFHRKKWSSGIIKGGWKETPRQEMEVELGSSKYMDACPAMGNPAI